MNSGRACGQPHWRASGGNFLQIDILLARGGAFLISANLHPGNALSVGRDGRLLEMLRLEQALLCFFCRCFGSRFRGRRGLIGTLRHERASAECAQTQRKRQFLQMKLHSDSPKGADISIPYGIRFPHAPQPDSRKSDTWRRVAIESPGLPAEAAMFDRRGFLSSMMAMAGAAPALSWSSSGEDPLAGIPAKLPDKSLYQTNEEAYWAELRRQFLIPKEEGYLENGAERLSDLGLRCLEPISRPACGVHRLHARRTGAGSQCHGGQQLHRQRIRHEGRRRSCNDRPGASRRRATLEPNSQELRHRGEESNFAEARAECCHGSESFWRSDYAADPRDFFQPHLHRDRCGLAGEGISGARAFQGNLFRGGRGARSGDDEAERS